MALDATKWEIRSDKKVRYVGGVHGNAAANYVTVLELHRFLQDRADDGTMSADDFIDISVLNPTDKKFETIIQLLNGFELDDAYTTPASEFIYAVRSYKAQAAVKQSMTVSRLLPTAEWW